MQALRIQRVEGLVRTGTIAAALTDDLGEYRLGGLARRHVRGQRHDSRETAACEWKPPRWRPSLGDDGRAADSDVLSGVTSLTQAQIIEVRSGEERTSTDFTAASGRLARVSVSFVDAKGDPAQSTAFLVNESAGGALRSDFR